MLCKCGVDRFSHYAEWPHASATGNGCQTFIPEDASRADEARAIAQVRHPSVRKL